MTSIYGFEIIKMTDKTVSIKHMRAPPTTQHPPKPCNKEIKRLQGVIIKLEKNLDVHQFAFTQLKKEPYAKGKFGTCPAYVFESFE